VRVSVVIPSYNSGRFVTEAVDSVLAQRRSAAEILVVDDGSADDTRQRLAGYGGPVRYLYQQNQGVSAARNLGVRVASGELIAFLDADDVWHPGKLETQVAVLERRPDLALLGTETFAWPVGEMPVANEKADRAVEMVPWRRLAVKNYFTTSSIVVRRAVLERAGPFDSKLQGPEDYDLWLRVAELAQVANLRLPLTGYRAPAGSLSKQADSMSRGMGRILDKLDERSAWHGDHLLRRKARAYCDYSCGFMFAEAGRRRTAAWRLVRSLAGYPLPFSRDEVSRSLARPKLLGLTLWHLLKGTARGRPTSAEGVT
jgi:glycosyltransferase involved in cell wall biosynthesis